MRIRLRVSSQESYNLLNKLQVAVARDEVERVDTLRYCWHQLQLQVCDTADALASLEPHLRRQLMDDVTTFTSDCNRFYTDYEAVSDNHCE